MKCEGFGKNKNKCKNECITHSPYYCKECYNLFQDSLKSLSFLEELNGLPNPLRLNRCECNKEKFNFTTHALYCPMHPSKKRGK